MASLHPSHVPPPSLVSPDPWTVLSTDGRESLVRGTVTYECGMMTTTTGPRPTIKLTDSGSREIPLLPEVTLRQRILGTDELIENALSRGTFDYLSAVGALHCRHGPSLCGHYYGSDGILPQWWKFEPVHCHRSIVIGKKKKYRSLVTIFTFTNLQQNPFHLSHTYTELVTDPPPHLMTMDDRDTFYYSYGRHTKWKKVDV